MWKRLRTAIGERAKRWDYSRARTQDSPEGPLPYPTPAMLADIWRQRDPINYMNLHLPDGLSKAIIPLLAFPLVNPGKWLNNNPAAGYVSWSGSQVAYKGTVYEIEDSNTNKKYIWWDKDDPGRFMKDAAQPSLDPLEDLLICYNDGGIARLVFYSALVHAALITAGEIIANLILTGSITAGDGKVRLDVNGLKILTGVLGGQNSIEWRQSTFDGNLITFISSQAGGLRDYLTHRVFQTTASRAEIDSMVFNTSSQWASFNIRTDTGFEFHFHPSFPYKKVVIGDGSDAVQLGIGVTSPTSALDVGFDDIRVRESQTPASAGAAGNKGEICWDTSYVYVCVATNTWKRAALSTW